MRGAGAESRSEAGGLKKVYDEVQLLLGLLLAVPAIVSLIQHWTGFSIAEALLRGLDFYRGLASIVFGPLYALLERAAEAVGWRLAVPIWLKDLHTLSIVITGMWARAFRLAGNTARGWSFWPALLIVGLSGLGLLTIPFMLLAMVGVLKGQDFPSVRTVSWATTLGVVGFYVTNGLLVA